MCAVSRIQWRVWKRGSLLAVAGSSRVVMRAVAVAVTGMAAAVQVRG